MVIGSPWEARPEGPRGLQEHGVAGRQAVLRTAGFVSYPWASSLSSSGYAHAVGLKGAVAVDARAAFAARTLAALVAAPGKLIRNVQLKAAFHDIGLRPGHEGRLHVQLTRRALRDGKVHGVHELDGAIGISVADPIVMMRAVEKHARTQRQRHGRGARQEQPVAKRHVRADRRAVRLIDLLGIAFLGNVLRGVLEQAAVAVGEDGGKVEETLLDAVMRGDGLRALDFLLVTLAVGNAQREHVLRAEALDRQGQKRAGIHAAAAEHERLLRVIVAHLAALVTRRRVLAQRPVHAQVLARVGDRSRERGERLSFENAHPYTPLSTSGQIDLVQLHLGGCPGHLVLLHEFNDARRLDVPEAGA